MSLLKRIACATALAGLLLASPASAQNKKVVLSQAFQSMLYLPLYVAINEGFFTQQGLDLTKETAGSPTVALSAVISWTVLTLATRTWRPGLPKRGVDLDGMFNFGMNLMVVNMAEDMRVPGQIMLGGRTRYLLVNPANEYPSICVEIVRRI